MAAVFIYWISTALLLLLYSASAFLYVTKPAFVRHAQAELGYSVVHLVPLLVVVKVLGPAAILWHGKVALSDLAYAGMFYHLLLSGLAHLGVHKPKGAIPAAAGLILLITSFATQNVARQLASPYAPTAAAIQTLFN